MSSNQGIYVKTSSGLGNQLFQIANGIQIASRLNTPLICDRSTNNGHTDREYSLEKIEKTCNFSSSNISDDFWPENEIIEYREKNEFKFDNKILSTKPGTMISGYFQHPSYSEESRSIILSALSALLDKSHHEKIIHIHLRRGDLRTNSFLRKKIGLLDISYYISAINYLDQTGYRMCKIKIFSDSPEEAADLFKRVFYNREIEIHRAHADALSNLIDLANTSVLIAANSTYSWWAAKIMEFNNLENEIIFPDTMVRTIPDSNILLSSSWKLLKPNWR